jgi:hypothetical protein
MRSTIVFIASSWALLLLAVTRLAIGGAQPAISGSSLIGVSS